VDIENLTVKQIREIQHLFLSNQKEENIYNIGSNYMVQTVTNYFIGKLEKVTNNEIILSECSWIPDTGVFSTALKNGVFEEVEPMPDEFMNIIFKSSIINIYKVNFKIPRERK
jgi:hypothetical protein